MNEDHDLASGDNLKAFNSRVNERNGSVRTQFTMFGRTFNVEVNADIPSEHLQCYIKRHISNLVWNEVFERQITEISEMITRENIKMRDDVLKRVGDSE